jgi:hypothetical protein
MALEATFRNLTAQIRKLHDTLHAVLLTIGDKPPQRGAALADELENIVLDMLGSLEAARTAARVSEKAVGNPIDLNRARRALSKCQEQFHLAEEQYTNELISYERVRHLVNIGSERRGEWIPWATSMRHGIEQCRPPFEEASKAMVACWQELAERVGTTNISVIGQQVTTTAASEAEKEGLT